MYELLLRERNAFHRLLASEGIEPGQFRWGTRHGDAFGWHVGTVNSLDHVGGKFFFALEPHPQIGWLVRYSPGTDSRYSGAACSDWDTVEHHIVMWAIHLRGELTQVDLWAGARDVATSLIASGRDASNSHFTADELTRVDASLDLLATEIRRTQSLTKLQTDLLLGAIEESRAAATRVGKKDWIMIFVAQLFSTLSAAAIQPDVNRAIVSAVHAAFAWLSGTPTLPPAH